MPRASPRPSPTRFVTAPALSFGAAVTHGLRALAPVRVRRTSGSGCSPPTRPRSRTRSSDCWRRSRWRPSVSIAGPKLVDPDDRATLLSYGESISRLGETVRLVDGELDQAQYDADGDVLGVTSSAMLVRRSCLDRARRVRSRACRPPMPGSTSRSAPGWPAPASCGCPDARVARGARPEDYGRRKPASERVRFRIGRAAQLHRRLVYAPGGALLFHWLALVPLAVLRSIGHLLGKRPTLIGGELASGFAAAFDGRCRPRDATLRRTRRIPWSAIAPLRVPSDELRERRAAQRERDVGSRRRTRTGARIVLRGRRRVDRAGGRARRPRRVLEAAAGAGAARRRAAADRRRRPEPVDESRDRTARGCRRSDRARPTRSARCSRCSAASRRGIRRSRSCCSG